jgi:hypothetical protein
LDGTNEVSTIESISKLFLSRLCIDSSERFCGSSAGTSLDSSMWEHSSCF